MSNGVTRALGQALSELKRLTRKEAKFLADKTAGTARLVRRDVEEKVYADQRGSHEVEKAGEGMPELRWPSPRSGVLAPRPEVLAPDPMTDRLWEYHIRKPEVRWAPLGSDSPFPSWARSDMEDSMPALTGNLELSCIDMPLYAATESGALTRAQVRALYSRGDSVEEYTRWLDELPDRLTPNGRQEFVTGGPRPRRGDLVFLHGSMLRGAPEDWVHLAVATGRVDPLGSPVLYSFYRDPGSPLSQGRGWGGTVTRETMSSLSQDWGRLVADLRIEFGPGPW